MASITVASVLERRAMLDALGPRPGREEVEQAQQALAKIDAQLAEQLESVYDAAAPPAFVNVAEWREAQELKLRESAEKEKLHYTAAIQLDELHQSYEEILEHEERALDGRDFEAEVVPPNPEDGSDAEASRLLQDAFENKREALDLSKRSMSYVPEFFGRIITLVTLDLSNNQLQLLPDSVASLVNLESLKLHSNQLKTLPDSIGLLIKLKYLDVSSNVLKSLPESLGRCSSLVELNANFNELAFLPSSFGLLLENLETLDLHLNKLNAVPSSICELKALKYLDLHMNKLKGLPSYLGNLSRLEYLDVSSNFNDLLSLPESMGDLSSLSYCDLSFNQIRELPDSLGRLEQLKTLKLVGNPIVVPPIEVVEQSHDAVMKYMQERWRRSIEVDQQASEGGTPLSQGGNYDYSAWVPAWAGNSVVGSWIGSWWGTTGAALAEKTGNLLGLQERQSNEFLNQQL